MQQRFHSPIGCSAVAIWIQNERGTQTCGSRKFRRAPAWALTILSGGHHEKAGMAEADLYQTQRRPRGWNPNAFGGQVSTITLGSNTVYRSGESAATPKPRDAS